jgi:hypothetical protein
MQKRAENYEAEKLVDCAAHAIKLIEQFVVPEDFEQWEGIRATRPKLKPEAMLPKMRENHGAIAGLAARFGEPLRVAVMGGFNSGKSSFINNLWKFIGLQGDSYQRYKRMEALRPYDDQFTMHIHADQQISERMPKLEHVRIEHEFFRHVNIIDTPGWNDNRWLDQKVLEFMSHVDVILFFCPANVVGGEGDLNVLAVKLANFRDTEMVCIITHSAALLLNDQGNVNVDELNSLISDLNKRIAREIPAADFNVSLGQNLFVLDNKTRFGLDTFLGGKFTELVSEQGQAAKQRIVRGQLVDFAGRCRHAIDDASRVMGGWLEFCQSYQDDVLKVPRESMRSIVKHELKTQIDERIKSDLELAVGDQGRIQPTTLFPERDTLLYGLAQPAMLVTESLRVDRPLEVFRQLQDLKMLLDTGNHAEDLFYDFASFRTPFNALQEKWLNDERGLLTAASGAAVFAPARVLLQLSHEKFLAERSRKLLDGLGERMKELIDTFQGEGRDSNMSVFGEGLKRGFELMAQQYQDILGRVESSNVSHGWVDRHSAKLGAIYGAVESPLPDVLEAVLLTLKNSCQRTVFARLRPLMDVFDIQSHADGIFTARFDALRRNLQQEAGKSLSSAREEVTQSLRETVERFVGELHGHQQQLASSREQMLAQLGAYQNACRGLFLDVKIPAVDLPQFSHHGFVHAYTQRARELDESLQRHHSECFAKISQKRAERDAQIKQVVEREQAALAASKQRQRERPGEIRAQRDQVIKEAQAKFEQRAKETDSRRNAEKARVRQKALKDRDGLDARARKSLWQNIVGGVLVAAAASAICIAAVPQWPYAVGALGLGLAVHLASAARAYWEKRTAGLARIDQDIADGEMGADRAWEQQTHASLELRRVQTEAAEKECANAIEKCDREEEREQAVVSATSKTEQAGAEQVYQAERSNAIERALGFMRHQFIDFESKVRELIILENKRGSEAVVDCFYQGWNKLSAAYEQQLSPLAERMRSDLEAIFNSHTMFLRKQVTDVTQECFNTFRVNVDNLPAYVLRLLTGPIEKAALGVLDEIEKSLADRDAQNRNIRQQLVSVSDECQQLADALSQR